MFVHIVNGRTRISYGFVLYLSLPAPVNPPNASAQSLSSTSISVQWSFNSSVRNVLGILRGFKVYYVKQNASEVHTLVTAGADESSLTLVNVEPFTTYKVSVGAFTLAGETIGNPVVVDTLQDGRSYDFCIYPTETSGGT